MAGRKGGKEVGREGGVWEEEKGKGKNKERKKE